MAREVPKKSTKSAAKKKSGPQPTKEHLDALAAGREQAAAIRRYLEAINRPSRRGRRPAAERSVEDIETRLVRVSKWLQSETDVIRRLELTNERLALVKALEERQGDEGNLEALAAGFIEHAAKYSERKGITYSAWREAGVPAQVLRQAGIARTRGE